MTFNSKGLKEKDSLMILFNCMSEQFVSFHNTVDTLL